MENVLHRLYKGQIDPEEQICPVDPKYRDTVRACSQAYEELRNRLGEDDRAQLEKLRELCADETEYMVEESFVYGFRLGLRIASAGYTADRP